MAMSINSLIANYTYGYQSQLRPNLDKDDDGVWSKHEVKKFASDYEKSTGSTLDVDELFKSYDKDGDGVFNAKEIDSIYDDDALNLSSLTTKQNSDGDTLTLSPESNSWMSSMTGKQWSSLISSSYKSEQTSSLLSSMMPASNSLFTLNYALMQYGATLNTSGLLSSLGLNMSL